MFGSEVRLHPFGSGGNVTVEPIRLLVIEDHPGIAENIAAYLGRERYDIDFASTGAAGLGLALTGEYEVIVLDLTLPRLDGIDLCRRLRSEAKSQVPVLMLTARDTLEDKLQGFEVGADDYLTKPFALKELEARILALARRGRGGDGRISVGDVVLDVARRRVTRRGVEVVVGPTGFRILQALMEAHPNVVTRADMEYRIWRHEPPGSDSLRTHVAALRKVLEKPFDAPFIETIYGVGFRLCPHADA